MDQTKVQDTQQRTICTTNYLKHRGASLAVLRAELHREAEDARALLPSIMTILFHAVSLAILGDNTEAAIHFQAIVRLVERYGGFLSLPYAARGMLMGCDHAVAVATMQRFTWSSTLYDPGPLELTLAERVRCAEILQSQPKQSSLIPEAVREFFAFHRNILIIYEVALGVSDQTRRTELLHWVLLRKRIVYSATQDKRCVLADEEQKSPMLSPHTAHLAFELSIRIAMQYLIRFIFVSVPNTLASCF